MYNFAPLYLYCTVLFYGIYFQQDLVVTAEEDIAQRVAQRERVLSGKKVLRCLNTMSAATWWKEVDA